MFKPLKQAVSLIVCIFKSWKVLDFCFFCGWSHNWGRFRHFSLWSSGLGSQLQEPIFWLKFLVET